MPVRSIIWIILIASAYFGCEDSNSKPKHRTLPGKQNYKYVYLEHPHYTLSGEQTGYNSYMDGPDIKRERFGLKFRLEAKSDTLHPIYLMVCSWDDHALTNNDNIGLGTSCDANFMSWAKIRKDEYLELITIANVRPGYDPTKTKFRVALILIDTTELDFGFYLFDPDADKYSDSLKTQKERYVWSNEIQLNRSPKIEQLPWGKWRLRKKAEKQLE